MTLGNMREQVVRGLTVHCLNGRPSKLAQLVILTSINRPSIYCGGRPSTAMIWKVAYLLPISLAFWYSGD
jgi:hypothetical protein